MWHGFKYHLWHDHCLGSNLTSYCQEDSNLCSLKWSNFSRATSNTPWRQSQSIRICGILLGQGKMLRSWQDSNLRSQWESDFESDALTTQPRLLVNICLLNLKESFVGCQKMVGQYCLVKTRLSNSKKLYSSQPAGFEPVLPEGIWFRVRRLNHSATTASWC